MRHHSGSVTFSALCAIVAGCAGGDIARDGYDADGLPTLALVEEMRLGSTDDPEVGFTLIGRVTVDSEGNVYVVEAQVPEIRVFDPRGTRLRTIGRRGEGPGELSIPDRIGFRGDTLWVSDHGTRRITMFSTSGAVLSSFPRPRPVGLEVPLQGVNPGASGEVLRSDGFVHLEALHATVFFEFVGTPPDSLSLPVLRYDRSGNLVDTLTHHYVYLVERQDEGDREQAVGSMRIRRPAQTNLLLDPGPPADTPLRIPLDGGLIVVDRSVAVSSDDADFTVTRTTVAGDTLYHQRFRYEPQPYDPAFADSLIEARGELDIPPFQPPVSQAQHGEDGTLWLRREFEPGPTLRWIVLAPDGTPRGQVDVPTGTTIRWIGADLIYAVERDEYDVPWLVRYRLEG